VQIDWEETINKIFGDTLACPRCGHDYEALVIGYSRKPTLNGYAPRHRNCPRGDECDARKLISLCETCARSEGLHGSEVDAISALESYMLDCRRDLEESLDYLAEYWRDDYELSPEEVDLNLEEVDPTYSARRRRGENASRRSTSATTASSATGSAASRLPAGARSTSRRSAPWGTTPSWATSFAHAPHPPVPPPRRTGAGTLRVARRHGLCLLA